MAWWSAGLGVPCRRALPAAPTLASTDATKSVADTFPVSVGTNWSSMVQLSPAVKCHAGAVVVDLERAVDMNGDVVDRPVAWPSPSRSRACCRSGRRRHLRIAPLRGRGPGRASPREPSSMVPSWNSWKRPARLMCPSRTACRPPAWRPSLRSVSPIWSVLRPCPERRAMEGLSPPHPYATSDRGVGSATERPGIFGCTSVCVQFLLRRSASEVASGLRSRRVAGRPAWTAPVTELILRPVDSRRRPRGRRRASPASTRHGRD